MNYLTNRLARIGLIIFLVVVSTRTFAAENETDFIEPQAVERDVVVTGFVFEDKNGNGKRDADEQGIKDVWVTDGEQIKPSLPDGVYELRFKVDEYRMVYITLPNGYKATSPWYQLIKQDDQEAQYKFDFALQRDPAALDKDFAFLVAADSQFSSAKEGLLLKADMEQITRSTGVPRFYYICGDLTIEGWAREWKWYLDAISALTIPGYNVYGGHEGNYGKNTPLKRGSEHHFNLFAGPTWYSWNYGGRHFIVYNDVHSHLSKAAQTRQEKWLRANLQGLKPGTEVVFIAHNPRPLDEWRNHVKIIAFFYGHVHENNLYFYKGTPYLCTNAIRGLDWGALTRTVRFCEFKNGTLITELRPTGQYKRVEIIYPPAGGKLPQGNIPLRVMACDTAARVTEVTVRCGVAASQDRALEIKLKKMGQFTWGAALDTSRMTPGTNELTVVVKDDRPESWPEKRWTFDVESRKPLPAKPGEDWPSFFKSLKELRTTSTAVTPPLDLVWSVATGGQNQWATSPILYRGRVYVGLENANVGPDNHAMQCYDAVTGERVWRTAVDACVRFSPAAVDGHIFFQSNTGTGYCLDANTGEVVWSKRIYPERSAHSTAKGAVLCYDGKALMYDEYGPVTIFGGQKGQTLASWPIPIGRLYYGGPFPDGDRVWLPGQGWAAVCDLITGKPYWKTSTKELDTRGVALGIIYDNVYYQRSVGGVAAFNPTNGSVLWYQKASAGSGWGVPVPTIADGVLYSGGVNMTAVSLQTNSNLWCYNTVRKPDNSNQRQSFGGHSSPLVSGNLVYLGRDDGDLVALDKQTGKLAWKINVGLPIKSSPVVSGNMLFVCDFDGNLYAFAGQSK